MEVRNNINTKKTFEDIALQEIFTLDKKRYMKIPKILFDCGNRANSYCLTNNQFYFINDGKEVITEPPKLKEVQFREVETGGTFMKNGKVYIKIPDHNILKDGYNAYDTDCRELERFSDIDTINLVNGTLIIDKV